MKNIIKITILFIVFLIALNRPTSVFGSYETETDQEIQDLNAKISSQRKKIDDIQAKQKKYAELVAQKQNEKIDLANQLEILNGSLEKSQLDIEAAELEIDKTNLEIKKYNLDIQQKDDEITNEKNHIANLLRLIYKQDQASTLEILLLNESLTDFIDQVKYLENTNKEIIDSVNNLKEVKDGMEENKKILVTKEEDLNKLKTDLENKKSSLESEQEDKNYILDATQQSEKQYQRLLESARKQQLQVENEISSLEKVMRQKMEQNKNKVELNYSGLIWPVTKSYITSGFHDPEYPYRRSLGEHSGTDIKAAQGTTLRAAADGYVARVKFDGSRSYAYIMIIHADGLSTVYGHISAANVSADQYVTQGQVIGKTGGKPGSAGSGPFCTGPHLHFEVRKNGIPVNPESYLP